MRRAFLYRHPKVQRVRVFGVADTRQGEEVCAWIVLKPRCEAAKLLLRTHALDFVEGNISDPAVSAEFRLRLPRHRSTPQVFIDEEHTAGGRDRQSAGADSPPDRQDPPADPHSFPSR